MEEKVQALIDAANALLAVTMKQYSDQGVGGRFVSDEEVSLCLAVANLTDDETHTKLIVGEEDKETSLHTDLEAAKIHLDKARDTAGDPDLIHLPYMGSRISDVAHEIWQIQIKLRD